MTTLVQSRSTSKSIIATPSSKSLKEITTPGIETPLPFDATPKRNRLSVKQNTNSIVIQTPQEDFLNESDTYHGIDKLQALGINAADISKLKSSGFCTVLSIIQATKKELCQIKGISEAKVEKIFEAACKIETGTNFMTGSQLLHKRATVLHITTGSSQLDEIIGGGIETMSITEIFGENRTGKTQICHTVCVTGQLPQSINGGNGKICFIDTEGTFRPEKIGKVAERYGLSAEAVLENIIYARAYTHEHLNQLLSMAAAKMIEDHFSVLIVDSIMNLFRVDFSGRGELAERQQVLNRTLSRLIKIAEQFNIAIIYTNHVMSDPGGGLTFVANLSKPIGGHVLGHASTTRLSLRKGKGNQRICKVYDSPNCPEAECVFELSDGGIIDAVE